MAAAETFIKDINLGGVVGKLYKITHDGSDTSDAIEPGEGYEIPFGAFTKYAVSSGSFTLTFAAGASTTVSYVLFLKP